MPRLLKVAGVGLHHSRELTRLSRGYSPFTAASSTSATVTEAWWCTDSTLTTLPYVAPYSFLTIFFGSRNRHRHLMSLARNRTLHGCRSIDLAHMLSVYPFRHSDTIKLFLAATIFILPILNPII